MWLDIDGEEVCCNYLFFVVSNGCEYCISVKCEVGGWVFNYLYDWVVEGDELDLFLLVGDFVLCDSDKLLVLIIVGVGIILVLVML